MKIYLHFIYMCILRVQVLNCCQPSKMQKNTQEPNFIPTLLPLSYATPSAKITAFPFVIGRALQCNLILHSRYISRKHVSISKKGKGEKTKFMIIGHSSKNIFVNNTEIKQNKWKELHHKSQIWLTASKGHLWSQAIGYLFVVKKVEGQSSFFSKYEKTIASQDAFIERVRLSLKCSRCSRKMELALNIQPCCHKICQNCANQMLKQKEENCPECKVEIVSFYADPSINSIMEAYNSMRSNSVEKNTDKKVSLFEKQPVYVKQQRNQSILANENTGRKGSKNILKKQKRVQWGSNQVIPFSPNQQQPFKEAPLSALELQLKYIEEQPDPQPQPEEQKRFQEEQQLHSQTMESALDGLRQKIQCYACKQQFKVDQYRQHRIKCHICSHFFCNLQYPPCKGGQPLKQISERIKNIKKGSLVNMIVEKFRSSVKRMIQINFKESELKYIFLYVICKMQGCFLYTDRDFQRQIDQKVVVCDQCWPSIANQMVIQFFKYIQGNIKNITRSNVVEMIQRVQRSVKQQEPKNQQKLEQKQQTPKVIKNSSLIGFLAQE